MSQAVAGDKVNRFNSVRPVKFGYVVRFAIERFPTWEGTPSCIVEVILASKFEPDSPQLKLRFFQATEMKIDDLNATWSCVVAIQDISDRGLEDTRYRVFDAGNQHFSLNCKDFEFEVLE